MNHLLDRALAQEERRCDRGVVLAGRHLAQDIVLAGRQLVERRGLSRRARRHKRIDHLGVDQRTAVGHRADRGGELLDVGDAFLQKVRAPRRSALQERERIARLGVLAQDDDPHVRVRLTQTYGGLDPLIRLAGRHAYVGEHDIGMLGFDQGVKGVEIAACPDDLEIGLRAEQPDDPLANEVAVLGENHPDRHGSTIRRSHGWTRARQRVNIPFGGERSRR